MKSKLTDLSVARIKPPASGRFDVFDASLPAFGVRVSATGRKTWIVAVRRPGAKNPARLQLGRYPDTSLGEARSKARALMRDPIGVIAEDRKRKTETAGAAIDQYIERHQKPRNRSWQEVARILNRELAGWRHRRIRDISRHDVLALLDQTVDRGSPTMANRLLAHVRTLFNWCLERGLVDTSPVAGIKAPSPEHSRDRVLTDGELAAVWHASDELGWPFRDLVRLLIVTSQRRDEVAHMAWDDLDLERGLWTLPRQLTKADRTHEVPLSRLALTIIERLPRVGAGLVFQAQRQGSTNPVSGFSKAKVRIDQLSGVSDWRFHDLRRSAASGMARLGHPPHVVAAVLNHSPGGTQGVTAIYNRHQYKDEKRQALDAWAREVRRIVGRAEARVISVKREVV